MPKTIRNLYDKKLTYDNLIKAHYKSRTGKGYRKEIILFNLKQEEYINYQNNSSAQSVKYESDMQVNNSINTEPISENNYNNQDFDWRKAYANLSKKEQHKIMKEVQKEANAEYRKQYEDYFRSLGYKIKHKWTFKDFLTVILVIGVLVIIVGVLWLIPPTHEYMINYRRFIYGQKS